MKKLDRHKLAVKAFNLLLVLTMGGLVMPVLILAATARAMGY